MAEAVLDASAVLALLRQEPGAEVVEEVIGRSLVCSVNLTEVVAKLIQRGAPAPHAAIIARGLPYEIAAYDEGLAVRAGAFSAFRSAAPLSLGDRACLALAQRQRLPALTADRRWIDAEADLGVRVRLIR
jgi:PIN domain nuclease of toxin-antitoxin system